MTTENKDNSGAVSFQKIETDEERRRRLKSDVGIADYAIVKQAIPDIPDEFLLRLMYGGR